MNRITTSTLFLCLLSSLFLFNEGKAQDLDTTEAKTSKWDRYLTAGIGSQNVVLYDQHMSPLNYYGGSLFPRFGYEKSGERSKSRLYFDFVYGSIRSRNATELRPMRGDYIRFDVDYTYLRYVKSVFKNRYKLYLGGQLLSHSNVRLNEQLDTGFITFIFSNSLAVSSAIERKVRWLGREITLYYQLGIPVISHVIRPSYLNIFNYLDPENDWVGERLDDSDLLTINKLQSFNSRFELNYPLNTNNIIRLSYNWDFYNLNNKLNAVSASHKVLVSFLFKF
ncbi:MAG: hypothetical protein AAFX87_00440 [Bacteroidota bacterium]